MPLWTKKVRSRRSALLRFLLTETIAAVDGAIFAGLERNLAGSAACGAHSVEHLPVTATAVTLAGIAAGLATLRLIGKALLSKKLLLSGSESELLAAIFADDDFVLEHVLPL